MLHRLTVTAGLCALLATSATAQSRPKIKEPEYEGIPLSAWIKDLTQAPAPYSRNAAAYAISGMGPAAKAAVPALIQALEDPDPVVRFPACIALREIGPDAKEAVPALTKALDDRNDDVSHMARKALIKITGEDPRPPEVE